jgi:hypothetical protein
MITAITRCIRMDVLIRRVRASAAVDDTDARYRALCPNPRRIAASR